MDGDDVRDPRRSGRPRVRALVAAGLLGAGVAALAILVALDPADPPLLGGTDRAWRDIALGAPAWVEAASHALKTLGAGFVMIPLRIVVALWLLARRRRTELAAWLLAWAVADAFTFFLKPGIGRLRPDGAHASSFPSAHAKTAAQVAIGLALLAPATWRPRRVAVVGAWTAAAVWILAMAISRTVLDEHWLSDIVAGSMLGAACALGAVGFVGMLVDRRAGPSPGG
ncbi:MAG: phosphatase PAP2 family protein [Actinomycetota bacterium]